MASVCRLAKNMSRGPEEGVILRDRLTGLSLTEVAKKHRVSRATVCRLVNECGGRKKTGVPTVGNQERVIPFAEGSGEARAAI